jgi:hypothetical protein
MSHRHKKSAASAELWITWSILAMQKLHNTYDRMTVSSGTHFFTGKPVLSWALSRKAFAKSDSIIANGQKKIWRQKNFENDASTLKENFNS